MSGDPPSLPPENFTRELREFTAACLVKDSDQRPNYAQLQEKDFFVLYDSGRVSVDVSSWYEKVKESK